MHLSPCHPALLSPAMMEEKALTPFEGQAALPSPAVSWAPSSHPARGSWNSSLYLTLRPLLSTFSVPKAQEERSSLGITSPAGCWPLSAPFLSSQGPPELHMLTFSSSHTLPSLVSLSPDLLHSARASISPAGQPVAKVPSLGPS